MTPPKQEPTTHPPPSPSEQQSQGQQSSSSTPDAPATKPTPNASGARGRGARGRARARGRRVVPRQVARRKSNSGDVPASLTGDGSSQKRGRGRGRGRGNERGGRGRGRGVQVVPTHSANAVGLGQIAPSRQSLSRGGGSRRGSALSSGAASSSHSIGLNANATGGSIASDDALSTGTFSFPAGNTDLDIGGGNGGSDGFVKIKGPPSKKDNDDILFLEHVEEGDDSEDDMPDNLFDMRNRDIAPYAGLLTDGGLLLPVSLPGLRSLPDKFRDFQINDDDDDDDDENENDDVKSKKEEGMEAKEEDDDDIMKDTINTAKFEPMEIEPSTTNQQNLSSSLRADMFNQQSAAHRILSSQGDLSFIQLPGLLPLAAATEKTKKEQQLQLRKGGKMSSVAETMAASERLKSLGVDIRHAGQAGERVPFGKLRFYKSGRVEMVMGNGCIVDVECGIKPKVNQQVVVVNCKEKTCDELENTVLTRLVAVPSLGDG